jgi:hypothetical protein
MEDEDEEVEALRGHIGSGDSVHTMVRSWWLAAAPAVEPGLSSPPSRAW